ncbi:DoxX family protein [Penaeicola halotolerans]|uniref:DoxX family protein n=1 Tax=Penaeicola halotolerans TaxID=2793196 RepID=UPI001CF7F0A7|nr:DoxX family protein [Penaeicola halotolerans]
MKNKIQFVVCLLMGIVFINAGLNKLLNYIPVPDNMPEDTMRMIRAMEEITWLMPLLGITEIIGGLLFIIPRFRPFGAVFITPIMVGILAQHFTLGDNIIFPVILFAILVWVIVENRQRYLPMVQKN